MDSILSDEPSQGAAPEVSGESESLSTRSELPDTEESASETPAPEPVKAVAKAEKPEPQQAQGDEAEDEGPDPVDVAGYKKALAAARGDKRKARKAWQEAERKLAHLEGQITALQQQRQQVKPVEEAKPDDPDTDFFGNPVGFVTKQVGSVQQQIEQAMFQQRLAISIRTMREKHQDFGQAESAFMQAAQKDPRLVEQLRAHEFPAEFAYQIGKLHLEAAEIGGDIGAWKERERQRIRDELQAEMGGAQPQHKPAAKPIPPKSIASARGTGAGVTQQWAGPRPLSEILGR